MEEFRDRIKKLMKQKGFTAKELGDSTDIGYRTIEGWLGAKKIIPRADTAVRVSKALGVSVEYLVSGEQNNKDGQSKLHRNFHEWVDSMDEEELQAMVDLFEVFDGIGKKLGK